MEQISLLDWKPAPSDRFGSTYDSALDFTRLNAQMTRVWLVMKDGKHHTLAEISARTGDPEASISARIRDFANIYGLKKDRRRRTDGAGQYEYQITLPWQGP